MTVYAITDTKKGEQGLRLLIFKLPEPVFGPLIYAEKWLQAESVIYDHHTQGQHWFFGT